LYSGWSRSEKKFDSGEDQFNVLAHPRSVNETWCRHIGSFGRQAWLGDRPAVTHDLSQKSPGECEIARRKARQFEEG
jgi:hypothetical protein